jgi:hypothetical protein
MSYHNIFTYSHITVNTNGHPIYHDCFFLNPFGKWKKDDIIPFIHANGNIFLYISSSFQPINVVYYNDCVLLMNIGTFEKGTFMDIITCTVNLYMWDNDNFVGDETLII